MDVVTNQSVVRNAMSIRSAQNQQVAEETQNRFLTLLVTQLQNQDPLNPLDNSEVTSQMAQLSIVNGINQLNTTMELIAGQIDLSQALSAGQFIGKSVLIPGNKIALGSDGDNQKQATEFGVDLMSDAAKVTVNIYAPGGAVVRTYEITDQSTGVLSFEWDGKNEDGTFVADGAYTFDVEAINASGDRVAVETLTYGHVGSVAYTAQGLKLDLGLAGQVPVTDLRKIIG